jgi:DNA-binding MarR family transcriptional regulator
MTSAVTLADYRALAELRYRIRHFLQEGDLAAKRVNLEPQQYLTLLAIRGLPAGAVATIGTLAERLALKHNSAVELINRMEKHGLVRRVRHEDDRREVRVVLSARGQRVLEKVASLRISELRADGAGLANAISALVKQRKIDERAA